QCATCSSVCKLAPEQAPFPRRQMLWAQWGLAEKLASDPGVWLCHQCNDCTVRCPRDAKPGDVMQTVRSLVVEHLAVPRFMGQAVANAKTTWPLLLGLPVLFWILLLNSVNGLTIPHEPLAYHDIVPHWLIYSVFFTVTGLVSLAICISGLRFWKFLGQSTTRSGSFFRALIPVLIEIATHKRFNSCDTSRSRKLGHLALFWGFVGAAVTSGLIIIVMYGLGTELPLALAHPVKILGNISALLLVIGGAWLLINRLRKSDVAGTSTAFDAFFLALVLLLIATGVLTEIGRLYFSPHLAVWFYIVHLGMVLCLFVSFPYSKFAHLLYRTLAMIHERMAGLVQTEQAIKE
ncbi:MAG: quinone-interacting membrane-bound oxidoreductase complex subunit QmoC, partial [Pseudomonadota bacterium]